VRSSFVDEDRAGALAAGVYESRVGVPASGVEAAVRQVLCSALSPGAVAYALAHGKAPAVPPVAVLVHAYLPGEADGSAALVPEVMSKPIVETRRGDLGPHVAAELREHLMRLATRLGPTEVEWVHEGGRLIFLQARPYQPPAPKRAWSGFAELGDDAVATSLWHWDVAHNPLPLSPCQAGLVELADQGATIGYRQRVLGGYLFYRADDRPLPPGIGPTDAAAFFESLRVRVDEARATLGANPDLEAALSLFLSVYEPIFGVLQPALREARRRLREFLEAHAQPALALLPDLLSHVPSLASERLARAAAIAAAPTASARAHAVADYLALFGDEAPAWDVCVATYAEDQAPLGAHAAAPHAVSEKWPNAAADVEAMLAPELEPTWKVLLAEARSAVVLGEADDWLYARAQALVRRALVTLGKRLQVEGRLAGADDVFFAPLSLLRRIASQEAQTSKQTDVAAVAAEGRRAWARALGDPPPMAGGEGEHGVRGAGTSGRAIGHVVHHQPGRAPKADAVLVATSLLPTELPLVRALAIVTETGGPLGHVAAQARERGIPAVVGATGACTAFADGDLVLVDADRGLVMKLDGG
jgi:phosphohistidine swiveling domain-containing protein